MHGHLDLDLYEKEVKDVNGLETMAADNGDADKGRSSGSQYIERVKYLHSAYFYLHSRTDVKTIMNDEY